MLGVDFGCAVDWEWVLLREGLDLVKDIGEGGVCAESDADSCTGIV